MNGDGEALALQSIADVITEARALVADGGPDYDRALIDLTMARLRPDVEFLILGADENVEAWVPDEVLPAPSNGEVKGRTTGQFIALGPDGKGSGSVIHKRDDCARLKRSRYGWRQATAREYADREWCLRCKRT